VEEERLGRAKPSYGLPSACKRKKAKAAGSSITRGSAPSAPSGGSVALASVKKNGDGADPSPFFLAVEIVRKEIHR
jgi:hypothetical protein